MNTEFDTIYGGPAACTDGQCFGLTMFFSCAIGIALSLCGWLL